MSDLGDFLLARIAEDERHARAAKDRIPLIYNEAALRDKGIGIAQAGHIARWDPARVLAECEAKRRIVEDIHEPYPSEALGGALACFQDGRPFPCPTLRLLALPYADHADYREEWKP